MFLLFLLEIFWLSHLKSKNQAEPLCINYLHSSELRFFCVVCSIQVVCDPCGCLEQTQSRVQNQRVFLHKLLPSHPDFHLKKKQKLFHNRFLSLLNLTCQIKRTFCPSPHSLQTTSLTKVFSLCLCSSFAFSCFTFSLWKLRLHLSKMLEPKFLLLFFLLPFVFFQKKILEGDVWTDYLRGVKLRAESVLCSWRRWLPPANHCCWQES